MGCGIRADVLFEWVVHDPINKGRKRSSPIMCLHLIP
jgi:hypothetical protein